MSDLQLYKINESTLSIQCNETITRELYSYFSAKMPNAKFHPLVKSGIWDGILRFFDIKNNYLAFGLLSELSVFAKKGGYSIEAKFEKPPEEIALNDFLQFVESLNIIDGDGNPMEPRDYQLQAAFDAINKRRLNIKSATASGKSLILYIIIRYFEQAGKKTILIVPNVSLVEQMYGDFESYGWHLVADKCHMIYSGQQKVFDCPVIVSTWQSLYKNKSLFKIFDLLVVDEAHTAKGASIKSVGENCINATHKIGCSGTYPEYKTPDWFSLVGTLGKIIEYNTYKSLQEAGHIAKLKIYAVELQYPTEFKRFVHDNSGGDYAKELDLIHNYAGRNEFLAKMAQNFDGNSLFLFTKVEKHGKPLYEVFKQVIKDKTILYIDGSTDIKDRELYRAMIEKRNDIVLLASYGTFSVGNNVKNLHHLVFASGYKSMIKVLQSLGRGIRKSAGKKYLRLYDIVDNLKFRSKVEKISYENFSMKHFKERMVIYEKEQFTWKIQTFKI